MKILSLIILLGAIAAFVYIWSVAENINQQLLACGVSCFIGIVARIVQAYDTTVHVEPISPEPPK